MTDRTAQGKPPTVRDPDALRRVAALLVAIRFRAKGREGPAAA
jgi:hypothetical protein